MLVNVLSAISIGFVIALMAVAKKPAIKVLIYSLPIPITIGLLATGAHISDDSVFGLILLCLFLWSNYYIRKYLSINALTADLISAGAYVFLGFILIKAFNVPFVPLATIYIVIWAVSMWLLKNHKPAPFSPGNSTIKLQPAQKGMLTFAASFMLLTLKNLLSGIVVTFPYSGVFAVIEAKDHLERLAVVFTRNSLAILGMFVMIYFAPSSWPVLLKVLSGWIVYLPMLWLLSFIPLYNEGQ